MGYRTVDMLVDQLSDTEAPPLRRATPEAMAERLGGPPPEGPEDFERILTRLEEDVLPFRSRVDHPGFFAFVPSSGTWPGALGDLIASACNVYAGSWMESAGPSTLELEVLGLVSRLDRAARRVGGGAHHRRLGGEPHRAGLRPRGRRRREGRASGGLPLRPGPLLAGPGGAPARLRPRPGPGAPHRRVDLPARAGHARCGDGGRPGRGPHALLRGRERGRHEHRRGRPAAGARRPLP